MSRGNADLRAGADHERANIQRGTRAERRYPCGVGSYGIHDGLHEFVFREGGHFQAARRVCHTLGIHVGTERDDATVFCGVGLQALKAALSVVKHAGCLREDDVGVSYQAAFIPRSIFPVRLITKVRRTIGKSEFGPIKRFLLHLQLSPRVCFLSESFPAVCATR